MNTTNKALELALKAQKNSYSPYSKFKVGACLKLEGEDKYYAACNVENASYGATLCAERNAIFQAIAYEKDIRPEFILLVTDVKEGAMPCGMCLQVMNEFCAPDMPVHIANPEKVVTTLKFKELLPHAFNKNQVLK